MRGLFGILILVGFLWSLPAASSEVCDAIELSGEILHTTFGTVRSAPGAANAKIAASWNQEVEYEIRRQQTALQMFNGTVPPEQFPWSVDQVRYLCTPIADKASSAPRACVFSQDSATIEAIASAKQIIQQNIVALQSIQSGMQRCRNSGSRGSSSGFKLTDGQDSPKSPENSQIDLAEPPRSEGRIFWSNWMIEKTPEVTQSVRDSLQSVWQGQVIELFRDFSALNLENGQGLHPDVRLVQEGDVSVYYRDGQRILAFYKPQGVYVRVFVEVPYLFRNKLGGAAAVNLMLKRTTLGNYAVYDYRPAPSLSDAYDSAFVERSIFQLEAMDQRAEDLLKSVTVITKGLEAGLERRFAKNKMRYDLAATILWLPSRIVGGGLGFMLGTSLAPLFSRYVGPEFGGTIPGVFLLSGMMMFSNAFAKLSSIHQKILSLMDAEQGQNVQRLKEVEEQRLRLLEFRGEIGIIRSQLNADDSCRSLLKHKISDLLEVGRGLNSL